VTQKTAKEHLSQ